MGKANYPAATDIFEQWRDEVLTGKALELYPVGAGELGRLEVGPGLVTLIGGAPRREKPR